jgi:seryl-tRNA synthetase
MTSNFTIETVDIDELRQQLAASSFELDEQKTQFKKQMAKQHKEIELGYEQIESLNQDEKKLRVKINQTENELEQQLKRLTIICKSKGLPRPKRPECLPETPARRSGNYVSPYGSRNASGSSAGRNLSNS